MTTRLGILTGGGDAPGLNAVIRAAVKTAYGIGGCQVFGIEHGFDGLLEGGMTFELTPDHVQGILPRGGTILGAANRGNPFARRVVRAGQELILDVSDQVVDRIQELGLDGLIVVGGDGTLRISCELMQKGCSIVGVPKTIDNDIGGTDMSFGFDTAVATATDAIDKLHTTAESHHRVMVLELMGRDAGFIALHAGVAGGADVILIPEIPFVFEGIKQTVMKRDASGRHFSIVAVAEGAFPRGGEPAYKDRGSPTEAARLGGMGEVVSRFVTEDCGFESRVTVLGHLQRGGQPTAFDRWLATRYGAASVRLALEGKYGRMVSLRGMQIGEVALEEAIRVPKRVDLEGDALLTARNLGICLGDA
jgi:6-phosphofructokinase 1